ncbi:MAG: SAM-dependent methyltransferase, partial [Chloroflexi bacterium]|nr:SAM-dependent methyltransferase [Chloroflexota bacterium]
MTGLFTPTEADAEVRRRIASRGPITFAEFMEVALYWPDGGYYASRRSFGPLGDFYTAPLAHPVFGALAARQLLTMWRAIGSPAPFAVIEAGAGDGTLALDVIAHAPALGGGFADAVAYTAVDPREPSPDFPARWVRSGGVPAVGGSGVVLANELLDAMPLHRVTQEGGRLRELFVDAAPEGGFIEVTGEPSTPALAERLDSLGVTLSEGFRTEVCLAPDAWLTESFAAIECGYLLLIDYGHEASVYYDESRRAGTLRCYS